VARSLLHILTAAGSVDEGHEDVSEVGQGNRRGMWYVLIVFRCSKLPLQLLQHLVILASRHAARLSSVAQVQEQKACLCCSLQELSSEDVDVSLCPGE